MPIFALIHLLPLVLLFFFLLLLYKACYIVQEVETILIERLGRYHRTLKPGLNIIIPFIDRPRQVMWSYVREVDASRRYYRFTRFIDRIDLRESVYDFPKQNVITKDNVNMEINALLYYQITDPAYAVYRVNNLPEAIEKLTQTTLRNVIGSMDLDKSLVSRDQINEKLRIILDDATDKWGVKVNRVELQEINPPPKIKGAMEKQMRADRDRRAAIIEAEGKKRAAILQAEGIKTADILQAEGEAKAKIIRARADAMALNEIKQATPDNDPSSYLIAMQYIKTLPQIISSEDKMVLMPYETSSLMSALASMKKVFEHQAPSKESSA